MNVEVVPLVTPNFNAVGREMFYVLIGVTRIKTFRAAVVVSPTLVAFSINEMAVTPGANHSTTQSIQQHDKGAGGVIPLGGRA